jgi:hypothetical protein
MQPLGYPLFIDQVLIVGGKGERPVVFAQPLLFSIVAIYFCQVLYALNRSPALFIVTTAPSCSRVLFGCLRRADRLLRR